MGEKPPTTCRFFDRTDYYSVHGADDAELIAKIVYKSTAYVRYMEDEQSLPYCTLSKNNFELAVRELLLTRNFRVEVYVRKTSGPNDWKLEYRGSPGNLLQFEDILFSNKDILVGTCILALQVKLVGNQKKLGIAAVQQNDCLFHLLEFIDNDFYTELEAIIVFLGPRECLLPAGDGEVLIWLVLYVNIYILAFCIFTVC